MTDFIDHKLTVEVELMNERGDTRRITATAATVDEAVALAESHAAKYPAPIGWPYGIDPGTWVMNDWWAA